MLIDVVCLLGRPCPCFFRFIGLCLSRVLETTFTSKANFFPKTLSKQLRKLELRVFACAINQAMIIATTQWRPSRMTTLHMRHAIFYSATGNCRLFLLALPGNLRYPFLSFLPFTFVLFSSFKITHQPCNPCNIGCLFTKHGPLVVCLRLRKCRSNEFLNRPGRPLRGLLREAVEYFGARLSDAILDSYC